MVICPGQNLWYGNLICLHFPQIVPIFFFNCLVYGQREYAKLWKKSVINQVRVTFWQEKNNNTTEVTPSLILRYASSNQILTALDWNDNWVICVIKIPPHKDISVEYYLLSTLRRLGKAMYLPCVLMNCVLSMEIIAIVWQLQRTQI